MDSTNESKPMDETARDACARLMERCGDPVYKFCRSLTRNRQAADAPVICGSNPWGTGIRVLCSFAYGIPQTESG